MVNHGLKAGKILVRIHLMAAFDHVNAVLILPRMHKNGTAFILDYHISVGSHLNPRKNLLIINLTVQHQRNALSRNRFIPKYHIAPIFSDGSRDQLCLIINHRIGICQFYFFLGISPAPFPFFSLKDHIMDHRAVAFSVGVPEPYLLFPALIFAVGPERVKISGILSHYAFQIICQTFSGQQHLGFLVSNDALFIFLPDPGTHKNKCDGKNTYQTRNQDQLLVCIHFAQLFYFIFHICLSSFHPLISLSRLTLTGF